MSRIKKKRDKPYRPHPVRISGWSTERIKHIEKQLDTANLLVELTLPAGKLSENDFDLVEDTVNWGIAIIFKRYKNLDQTELNQGEPLIRAAREVLNAIYDRKSEGKTQGFVATGDELKVLSDTFAMIVPMIKEALKLGPKTALQEYAWSCKRAVTNAQKAKEEKNL
ncbi:hypothetical protein [Turicimonas sp. TL08]